MSDTPDDPQRPEGDLPQDPTAADWSPPPVEATQPIDPSATSAIPVPPPPDAPPTPPGNPYGAPAANPYAAPPANPYAAPPANPYGAPPAGAGVPPQPGPPAYGQGVPPYAPSTPANPYAVNQGQPAPQLNPYATGGPAGYPPPGQPPFSYQQAPQRRTNVSAIVLLILSGLTLLACCLVEIPAVILAIVALTKQNDDPAGSRRLTTYGWIAFGVGLLIAVVVAVLLYANGFMRSDTPSGGYSY